MDLNEIRNGKNVYCMAKEWEREKFVREMNDRALERMRLENDLRRALDGAIHFFSRTRWERTLRVVR